MPQPGSTWNIRDMQIGKPYRRWSSIFLFSGRVIYRYDFRSERLAQEAAAACRRIYRAAEPGQAFNNLHDFLRDHPHVRQGVNYGSNE